MTRKSTSEAQRNKHRNGTKGITQKIGNGMDKVAGAAACSAIAMQPKALASAGAAGQATSQAKTKSLPGMRPGAKPRKKAASGTKESKVSGFLLHKEDETAFFAPKTWSFWRGILMYLFIFSVVGHWMEIPYCLSMDALFGIVDEGYAIWEDPLWVPYWVYGVGAAVLALTMLPLKIHIIRKRKTMAGAVLQFFVIAVVLCAAMECIMGWIINQPDEFGEFPFWDNSQLPLNIFGQAWLVNDFFLGLVSLGYVWVVFPFCQKLLQRIGDKAANRAFVATCIACAVVCLVTYVPLTV